MGSTCGNKTIKNKIYKMNLRKAQVSVVGSFLQIQVDRLATSVRRAQMSVLVHLGIREERNMF